MNNHKYDLICCCGHKKNSHFSSYLYSLAMFCDLCRNMIGQLSPWHEFKADNIKYLEQMVKTK